MSRLPNLEDPLGYGVLTPAQRKKKEPPKVFSRFLPALPFLRKQESGSICFRMRDGKVLAVCGRFAKPSDALDLDVEEGDVDG